MRVVKREIRGFIIFLKSSRKCESFEGSMSGSVESWLSERFFGFPVVAWA